MTSPTYLIPHHGMGAVQSLPIHGYCGPTLSAEAAATLRPESLGSHGGWLVELDGRHVGTISSADRSEYPEIDMVYNAGLTPAVTLQPGFEGTPPVARLPRPGLCLPANNPPRTPWALLAYAPPLQVTEIPEQVEIDQHARIHLLITLRAEEQDPTHVSAFLGSQFIATLGDASPSLIETIARHRTEGLSTLAHAYHFPRGMGRVLNIYAGPEESKGTGQERLLSERAPTSSFAATTFETSSFRAITDADLAQLDSNNTKKRPPSLWIWLIVVVAVISALAFGVKLF